MFENITAGWKVASATRKLIFKDKRLLLYPIISGIAGIAEFIALFAILAFGAFGTGSNGSGSAFYLMVFLFYVLIGFTTTYVMMAMLIAFRSYAAGKKMGMMGALRQTSPYSVLILEWSIFYTIIVFIIRAIENRIGGIAGMLLGDLASLALGAATIFVVPIILEEKVDPINAIRMSAKALVKNFGQTFGGLFYTDLYSIAVIIVGAVVLMLGIVVASSSSSAAIALGIILAVVGIAAIIFGILVGNVLSNVYRLILYDYMRTGKLPDGFTKDMVNASVKQKSGRQTQSGMF